MTMRRHKDDGASMVMVLLVVVFISLVSTAFLTKSGTEFRAAAALQTKVRLQYGADAGLEKGISVLSAELATRYRTHCLTPFDGAQTISTFSWGSSAYPVTVTCQDLQGYAADDNSGRLYGAAIVTTGGDGSLQTQSAGSTSLDVAGTIFASGRESSGMGGDLKKPVSLTKGDYVQSGCIGSPNVTAVTVTPPFSQFCNSLTAADVAPGLASLPTIPTSAVPPQTQVIAGVNCQMFFPGKYVTAPALLSGAGTANYFASGNYYFDPPSPTSLTIAVASNVTVVAGAPTPGDVDDNDNGTPTPAAVRGCATDSIAAAVAGTQASAITGTGAAFFMGGKSYIDVANGILSMYSRPFTPGVDVPLNIYALRASDVSLGWDRWNGGTTDVVTGSSATSNMLFNGQINAYDAPVDLFASNPTITGARAGIVAKKLKLQASAAGTNLDVTGYGTSATFGSRIMRLTVHAAGRPGDAGSSDGVAVVIFPNDLSAPAVKSWRFS